MFRFETKRLQMRPFKEDDKKRYIEICLDNQIKKYFNIGENCSEIANFFESSIIYVNDSDIVFAIHYNNNIIGFIDYCLIQPDSIMIAYAIEKQYRKEGFATEALTGILKYIKNIFPRVDTAVLCIHANNTASLKTIEKFNPTKCNSFTYCFKF